jgi:hypothetical protein
MTGSEDTKEVSHMAKQATEVHAWLRVRIPPVFSTLILSAKVKNHPIGKNPPYLATRLANFIKKIKAHDMYFQMSRVSR